MHRNAFPDNLLWFWHAHRHRVSQSNQLNGGGGNCDTIPCSTWNRKTDRLPLKIIRPIRLARKHCGILIGAHLAEEWINGTPPVLFSGIREWLKSAFSSKFNEWIDEMGWLAATKNSLNRHETLDMVLKHRDVEFSFEVARAGDFLICLFCECAMHGRFALTISR